MARQQSKRRRKRYQAGSSYAGDVRPAGVLGFLGSGAMIKLIFIGMALALAVGGGTAIFGGSVIFRNTSSDDFVVPDENDASPSPEATVAVRQYDAPPAMTIDASKRYTATISTALGDIEVELLADQTPQTVNNFVFLARDGFYNGLTFHYADSAFSANAGDPACTVAPSAGAICRGNGGPGYGLPQEAPGAFEQGTLGMANGSQFFIALADSPQFDEFTPFGRITSGLDIAEQITAGTEITSITIAEQ